MAGTCRYPCAHHHIAKLLLGLTIAASLCALVGGRVYDTEPETALEGAMKYLAQPPGAGKHGGAEGASLTVGGVGLLPPAGGGTRDVICNGCLSALTFIKTLIMLGMQWNDVRNDTIKICKSIVTSKNWKGDILCPHLMDNFGPPVYYAIKKSRKSAKKICIHMNWCDPYDLSSNINRDNKYRERRDTATYLRHFRNIMKGLDLHGMKDKMADINDSIEKPTLQELSHSARQQILGQFKVGQTEHNVAQGHPKVKTPIVPVPHVPRGLRIKDLPMISKLLADLDFGGTDFSQRFTHYVHLLGSSESWQEKIPIQKLIMQSKILGTKINKAMTNLQSKGAVEPDARRMAELIGAALTRTAKRLKRHLGRSTDNLLKVVQLSDIHVEQEYITGAATDCGLPVCCRPESQGNGTSGVWGEGECNAPPSTIRKLMQSAAAHSPDFVIYTGDNPPHTVWLETLERQLNASRWVARELAAHFQNTTVYPNMGNHENFPLNLYHVPRPETQTLNREWAKMFTPVAGFGPEQIATINKAGYYTTLIKPGLRLIAYNSNYGGVGNFMNILNYDRPEFLTMVNWLEQTLAYSRHNSEYVFVTSHHQSGMQENVVTFDELITPIFVEYSDVIMWHPCGHVHRDEFRLTLDPANGDPVGVTFIAQSMNTYPDINPGYRIYYFDPETFEALDYEQYNIDIAKANKNPENEDIVSLSYRASEMYGLVDLTPASMMGLYNRLMADDALLQRYWGQRRGGTGVDGDCDAACRQSQQCRIISPTFDVYRACMRHLEGAGRTSRGMDESMIELFTQHYSGSGVVGFSNSLMLLLIGAQIMMMMMIK